MLIFQERLKEQRELCGYTQRHVARLLGISHASYFRYEIGTSEPTQENLVKLADIFGTTIDYLVGHSPSPKQKVEEEVEFTKEEISLLYDYRSLSKEEKASIRLILKNYLRNKNASNK